jgi:hypothetical protein
VIPSIQSKHHAPMMLEKSRVKGSTAQQINKQGQKKKLKYFPMQKYSLQKNPLKGTKILQDIIIL